jgi:hypothetical protein
VAQAEIVAIMCKAVHSSSSRLLTPAAEVQSGDFVDHTYPDALSDQQISSMRVVNSRIDGWHDRWVDLVAMQSELLLPDGRQCVR